VDQKTTEQSFAGCLDLEKAKAMLRLAIEDHCVGSTWEWLKRNRPDLVEEL
jgi:hypothetical protein